MNVLFTTPLPVPYQAELFDALAASGKVDIHVLYTWRTHTDRTWESQRLAHNHSILSELSVAAALDLVRGRDLVVFSGYHPSELRRLISIRAKSCEPWAFWGERPGFILPNWIGHYYRQAVLPQLRSSMTPIWGIGSWAVDAYRREFGSARKLINVPYFSRLDLFSDIDRSDAAVPPRRILFSGSLIKRKGVDLLLKAFIAIAAEFPELELHLIGDGPMLDHLRAMSTPVAERVHFHGFKQRSDLLAYYATADVLCAPSRYDGWGLVIPEGLASGLLVVSTNRTGAALDLVDAQCGWIVQAGALDPLIEALRAVASTNGPERLARIARGRSIAIGQDVKAGIPHVLAAVKNSLDCANILKPTKVARPP
jgi:glycosyltransferase involved in cell wall biosynthesis